MPFFAKDSLELLRQRIDIVDVLMPHVDLKKSGAAYKGICPFHDEKTPSFTLQKGDTHYHCFGCGAHGDAIQFLMQHVKLSFSDAVEQLAQRFGVVLERADAKDAPAGPNKALLKTALEHATRFYQFYLLHTPEGAEALKYLYARGIDLEFIRKFQIGLSPKQAYIFRKAMYSKGLNDEILFEAGLVANSQNGSVRDFFYDRIMFPIRDSQGSTIGFSGRKFKDDTFGGKYVNTAETALFKKSRVLFGLNYSRKRIAKERRALIVEGQIDALRLIQAGFNIAVASQGTAFGEGHAKELINLGTNHVYIASDGDTAGLEAACKIGNIFQREGVDVSVLAMPTGSDPDAFICNFGADAFLRLMDKSVAYMEFLVNYHSRSFNIASPARKNELAFMLAKQIRDWQSPLMVHESLRQLAHLLHIPESSIGVGEMQLPNLYIKQSATAGTAAIDPDRVLEFDCLRWFLLIGSSLPKIMHIALANITDKDFRLPVAQKVFNFYVSRHAATQPCDLLSLIAELDDADTAIVVAEMERKVNLDKAEQFFIDAIQRLMERNWMQKREDIKAKIQSGNCSDDEAMDLVKEFDLLKRLQPKVVLP